MKPDPLDKPKAKPSRRKAIREALMSNVSKPTLDRMHRALGLSGQRGGIYFKKDGQR